MAGSSVPVTQNLKLGISARGIRSRSRKRRKRQLKVTVEERRARWISCSIQLPAARCTRAGESFPPMELNQDAGGRDLNGEQSAVVAEIVTVADSTLGLQKGVLEVGDDGAESGGIGDGSKQGSAQSIVQADPKAPC